MFGLISKKRLDTLQREYDELKLRLDNARETEGKNKILENEITTLKNKIAEIEKQLREQTEADLFFTSAKIQKKLLDGEPKENIQELRLQQLAFQNALQQQQFNPYQQNSFLGALGLGSLFGRY